MLCMDCFHRSVKRSSSLGSSMDNRVVGHNSGLILRIKITFAVIQSVHSLVPRPRPTFHRLQYEKAVTCRESPGTRLVCPVASYMLITQFIVNVL